VTCKARVQISIRFKLPSNSKSLSCALLRMIWFLKLPFDQNSIIINYKSNGDLRVTSFLEGHKSDTRGTCSITLKLPNFVTILSSFKVILFLFCFFFFFLRKTFVFLYQIGCFSIFKS
jgi:hypothetical protein